METFMKELNAMDTSQKMLYAVGGVVAVVSVVAVRKLINRKAKKEYPHDKVIAHQMGRGHYAPSMSPFCIKLETYLRMAKIPYQNIHSFEMSSKSKIPWIEFNGQEISDTTLCIKFLNQTFGVDLNRNLSPADRGVAQAMQVMVEEHLYWILVLNRWQYDNDKSLLVNTYKFGKFVMWNIGRYFKKQLWHQGLGRHTEGEVTDMLKEGLQSLSDFVGTKKFLMGDEPCETDCAVFGQLSQFYWHFSGTGHDTIIKDKYPTLAAYCERMKETFWPDWNQCITHGGTREATK